jgi:hypothetical protein
MINLSRALLITAVLLVTGIEAEKHTISFKNNCGRGKPQLIQGGNVLSNGEDYHHDGIFSAGIAYLQTGECGFNAERCAMLEMTLVNPSCVGCGSSTDISLIPDHALNVPVAFSYYNGCDGKGATCLTPDCNTAFFVPDDTTVQVACQEPDVNLLITFCPDGNGSGSVHSTSKTSSSKPTSSAVHTSSSSTSSSSSSSSTSEKPTVSVTPVTSSTSQVVSSSATTSSATSVAASGTTQAVNRKKCKPGQKPRRKRDAAIKRSPEELLQHDIIARHRRGHAQH